jgi:GNAT superfamily N-acetyltransferase
MPIVQGIDAARIAGVIEDNINAYLLSFARLPGAILHRDHQSVWIDAGIPDATLNAVTTARFDPDGVDAQIEAVLGHFRRVARPFTWHIGPSSAPPDLGRILPAHGLRHSEDEPGMALDLASMREAGAFPSSLTIDAVDDDAGLAAWVSVWLFPVPDAGRRRLFDALRLRGVGRDLPWRYYVGRLGEQPVACAELFVDQGVAAVHYVVTLPQVRRGGIGAAMTRHVLREARAQGYRVAVLTASPEGIGIYRRVGFQDYCWFHRYEWEPDEDAVRP